MFKTGTFVYAHMENEHARGIFLFASEGRAFVVKYDPLFFPGRDGRGCVEVESVDVSNVCFIEDTPPNIEQLLCNPLLLDTLQKKFTS